jgi:hypothetical protein
MSSPVSFPRLRAFVAGSLVALAVTAVMLVVFDQIVVRHVLKIAFEGHLQQTSSLRQPRPYIEFAGQPGALDHNRYGYRWDADDVPQDAFRIAFFGGSTGYLGSPPIATLVQHRLERTLGRPVRVANFSVVSSNHRQHLHNIVESNALFKPDLVLFYGGYNETAQTAFYDPRPGYPYNFFYRGETSPIAKALLENVPTAYLLELLSMSRRLGDHLQFLSLTPLARLRAELDVHSDRWNEQLVAKYFETLDYAGKLSRVLASTRCAEEQRFRSYYQPYQVPDTLQSVHRAVKVRMSALGYGRDLSAKLAGEDVYTDVVHVNQRGNELMAAAIAEDLLADGALASCMKL